MCTCLCEGVASTQVADYYDQILQNSGDSFGLSECFMAVKVGDQCTISGCGNIFDNFMETGEISNYLGYAKKPVRFFEDNFDKAPFRMMKYDQTFDKMPYDCRKSMLN